MKRLQAIIATVVMFAYTFLAVSCGSTSNVKSTPKNASSNSNDIVAQFDNLAMKLLQPPKNGAKAVYAFLDLSTDDNNTLVERYITDALTEAVFNTGSVKIIEKAYIDKILSEQTFQASGYVSDETAASIGNTIGAEYVCYGTIKDVGNSCTVNARVVDVESAEICAMSRAAIIKDDYLLKNAGKGTASQTKSTSAKSIVPASIPTSVPVKKISSLWTCTKNRNDFDGCTIYTFTCPCADGASLFFGYEKRDNPLDSKVRACPSFTNSFGNIIDIKLADGRQVNKELGYNYGRPSRWYYKTGTIQVSENAEFFKIYKTDVTDSKDFYNFYKENDIITIREKHDGIIHRFQTSGFIDVLGQYGITDKEIMDAFANEEF